MENEHHNTQHMNGNNQTRWDKTITCMKTPSFLLWLGLVNLIILLRLIWAVMNRGHMWMRGGDMRDHRMMKWMMMRGYPQGNMMYERGQTTTNWAMMQRINPSMDDTQAMEAQKVQGQTIETTTVTTQ